MQPPCNRMALESKISLSQCLEAEKQHILKIFRCLCKIMKLQFDLYYSSMVKQLVQVADTKGEKNCPGLMLVVLVNRRSEETLGLLMNFQKMSKSSFIMD